MKKYIFLSFVLFCKIRNIHVLFRSLFLLRILLVFGKSNDHLSRNNGHFCGNIGHFDEINAHFGRDNGHMSGYQNDRYPKRPLSKMTLISNQNNRYRCPK